jgi:hypothetical protein
MYWRRLYVAVLSVVVFLSMGVSLHAQKQTAQNRDTLWIIPQTHWEDEAMEIAGSLAPERGGERAQAGAGRERGVAGVRGQRAIHAGG